jgi:hypothetical protein
MMLDFSIAACLVAALASWLRGGKYVHETQEAAPEIKVNTDSPERIMAAAETES